MREIQKSVALVVREFDQHFELLVFDHPNAGTQVVKGTVERGESPEQAVIRELEEESGLVVDHPGKFVGTWDYTAPGILGEEHHTWHLFWIAAPSGHESTWDHRPSGSLEEEQHCFSFRWVRIDDNLQEKLHSLFGPVARHVKEHLSLLRSDLPRRQSTRGIVKNQAGEVLFIRCVDDTPADPREPDVLEYWVVPGGGLEPGESDRDGLRRELREETGLEEVVIGECCWERELDFVLPGRGTTICQEKYFLCESTQTGLPAHNRTACELDVIQESRWWAPADIVDSTDIFRPIGILYLIQRDSPTADLSLRS